MSTSGTDRPPEFSQLLREIDSVVSTSEYRHRSELQTLRQQVVDSGSQVGSLERRLQSQTQQNGVLQSELQQLQRQLRQYSGVSEQLEDLRAQSEQLRHTHEQSKAKHKRHTQRAKERQAQLEAENSAKTSDLESARQSVQAARMQVAATAADGVSCKEELNTVRQRSNSLAEKCSLLRQQLEQCEADRTSFQCQMHANSEKYQGHIAELESKVHNLRMTGTSNLELTKSSLDKAQAQVHQLTEENLSLRRQGTKSNGDLELMNVNYACLKDELSAIKEDLLRAQGTEKRDACRLAELEHKLLQKDDVIRAFEESQERTTSSELNRLRQEVDSLTRRLQRASTAEADLQSKLARLGERAESCQQVCDSRSMEMSTLRSECDHYRKLYQEMQSKEATASEERTEAQRSRLEALQLQSRLSAREEEARRWGEQVCSAEDQLRKTCDAHDACQAQLKVANAQLDELRLQNASLRSSLHLSTSSRPSQSAQHQLSGEASAESNPYHSTPRVGASATTSAIGTAVSTGVPSAALSQFQPHRAQGSDALQQSRGAAAGAVDQHRFDTGMLPVDSLRQSSAAQHPASSQLDDGRQQTSCLIVMPNSQLMSPSQSSMSKFSDMGSVSSLTTSDSEATRTGQIAVGRRSTGAPATPGDILASGNARFAGVGGHAGTHAPVTTSTGPSHARAQNGSTTSFTPGTMAFSSTLGDLSDIGAKSTVSATAHATDSSAAIPMMSEEFVQDFLTDNMSHLQSRIEETMEKLGLTKEVVS